MKRKKQKIKKGKKDGSFYFSKEGTKVYLPKKDSHMKKANRRMR